MFDKKKIEQLEEQMKIQKAELEKLFKLYNELYDESHPMTMGGRKGDK